MVRAKAKEDQPSRMDLFGMVTEELERSIYTPNVLSYKPWGAQIPFHKSQAFGRILTAGNRKGKTDAMVVENIRIASNSDPDKPRPKRWGRGPVQLRIVSVDVTKGIENILLPKFKRWMSPSMLVDGSWDKSWDKGSLTLTFSNGSTIDFLTYQMTLEKHAGVPRHMVSFDEEPPRDIFNESLMRLMDYDGFWIISATPINGMEWIFDLLVEPALAGELENVEVFELVGDNPYLQADDKSKFMMGMDKEERQIRGEGKFIARSGLIFPLFKDRLDAFVLPEPPDIYSMLMQGCQIYSTVDHGWNNPTAWLWIAVYPDGDCVVFGEHYASEVTVPEHAQIVLEKEAAWGFPEQDIIRSGDPAMKQTSGITGTSVLAAYADCGVYIGVETIPHDVSIGLDILQQYLRLGASGVPKLRVSPNCPHLIRELKKLRWATYDSQKTAYSKNKQELIHKKDDHAFDSLRYWATQMPDLKPEVDIRETRDKPTRETLPYSDLMARMSEDATITFADDTNTDWKVTESLGDYYSED